MAVILNGTTQGLQTLGSPANPLTVVQVWGTGSTGSTGVGVPTLTITAGSAQNAGDTNIFGVSVSIAGDISGTPTDSAGNTYTAVVSQTNGLYNLYTFVCVGIAAFGVGNVFTVNFTASVTASIQGMEWSGVAGVDANVVSATGATANSTATLASQYPHAAVMCFAIGDAVGTPTAGTGFTLQSAGNTTALAYIMESAVELTLGNVTCGATAVGSTTWTTVALALYQGGTPPTIDGTYTGFFKYVNGNAGSIFLIAGVQGDEFVTLTIGTATANQLTVTTLAGLFTTTIALVAATWYHYGVTVRTVGTTQTIVLYYKRVGDSSSVRVTGTFTVTPSLPIFFCYGIDINDSITNVLPSYDTFLSGTLSVQKFWWNLFLTQADIERESEQLEAVYPNPWSVVGFSLVTDLTDQSGGSTQQLGWIGSVGTNTSDPPISRTKTRRFVRKKANATSLPFEEPSGLSAIIVDPDPTFTAFEGEDTASVSVNTGLDESSRPAVLFLDDTITVTVVNEDYSGVHPTEEFSTWKWIPDEPFWISSFVSEDYSGVHPTEEFSTWKWIPDEPQWITAPPNEDYAGSIPSEELGPIPFLFVEPDPTFVAFEGEDYAGTHPTEEFSTWRWVPDEPFWIVAPPPEDFAGSTPLEEPSVWSWVPLDPDPFFVAFAGEDYSGVHPTEEFSTWRWVPDEPFWITAPPSEEYPNSVPLEEPSGWQWIPLDPDPFFVAFEGEDYAGTHPTEEFSTWKWVPADEPLPAISASNEDIGTATFAAEEFSIWQWVPADEPLWLTVVSEEYAGSLPLEEPPGFSWTPLDPDPTFVAFEGEDYGGVHPTEEFSTWRTVPDEPQWIVASLSEEYAGSAPLEEPSGWQWVPLEPDLIFNAFAGEDYGGTHPTEEFSTWNWTPDEPQWITSPPSEEYAGSIPSEETSVWTSLILEPDSFFVAFSGEEYSGVHPTEETAFLWPLPIDTFFGIPSIGEDFAGALPLEETFATPWITPDDVLIATSVSEDGVPSTALEEASTWTWTPVEDPWITINISEEVVNAGLAVYDDSLPPWIPPEPFDSLPPPVHEFVSSFTELEEPSPVPPWIAPDIPTWLRPLVGEDIVVPVTATGIEEVSTWYALRITPPISPSPSGEDIIIPVVPPPPPPPPPPPTPVVPKPPKGGGGGGFVPWESQCPPGWEWIDGKCRPIYERLLREIEEEKARKAVVVEKPTKPVKPKKRANKRHANKITKLVLRNRGLGAVGKDTSKDVHYAILPLVRALAPGEIVYFTDPKAGPSVKLTADDGTIYYYANVKRQIGAEGEKYRVERDDVIGYTDPPRELPPTDVDVDIDALDTDENANPLLGDTPVRALPPAQYGVLPIPKPREAAPGVAQVPDVPPVVAMPAVAPPAPIAPVPSKRALVAMTPVNVVLMSLSVFGAATVIALLVNLANVKTVEPTQATEIVVVRPRRRKKHRT